MRNYGEDMVLERPISKKAKKLDVLDYQEEEFNQELEDFLALIEKNKEKMMASEKRDLYLAEKVFSRGERISEVNFI